MKDLTLDVAISTYQPSGLQRVEKMLPEPRPNVRYVVSWQAHEDAEIPDSLADRRDVEIHRLDIKGLSNNRNNAIQHCKGDIILIADDDLAYLPDFSDTILKTFKDNPELDLATFKIDFAKKKDYPKEDVRLEFPLPKNYYVSSVEIAFKRDSLKGNLFSPELGLGAPLMNCGEEEIFLLNAIKGKKECRFINRTIASHREDTTSNKITSGVLRGQGFVMAAYYPFTFPFRLILKAYRLGKNKQAFFFKSLPPLFQGSFKRIFG